MSFNLRPAPSDLSEILLEQLNIMDTTNNNHERNQTSADPNNLRFVVNSEEELAEIEQEQDDSFQHNSFDYRALAPRVSSLENSLMEHINSSVPSLDEIVIRQRGRKKQPAKISWSPVKSPFKTPTKKNSSLHMSLLSPSPAKKLFHNSSMTLRSSPRKRLLIDTPSSSDPDLASSSTPVSTPTKRLKFFDDRPMNATNSEVPLRTLLKGLSHDQLLNIICDMSARDSQFEEGVRKTLPLPDVRLLENQLNSLRKNITRSSPRSRLLSRTDGAAFSRASDHLISFRKAISNHCKMLNESQHFDALIDYILVAWSYVAGLPVWDEATHNIVRKECFRILSSHARTALKHAGTELGTERITNFQNKIRSMISDSEDIGKCQEALNFLSRK